MDFMRGNYTALERSVLSAKADCKNFLIKTLDRIPASPLVSPLMEDSKIPEKLQIRILGEHEEAVRKTASRRGVSASFVVNELVGMGKEIGLIGDPSVQERRERNATLSSLKGAAQKKR